MALVRAASAKELPPGGRLAVEVAGRALALFNVEGRLFAIEDRCAHQFVPLSDGALSGTRLTCRWHGWSYELDPAKEGGVPWPRVARFEVRVEAGEVYVALPDGPASPSTIPGSCPGRSTQ
ncbi:MAG TPA: Rieske 2Fe-2S domain-containing protein [Planctomycetota bacterium]|nr:Rieske 2Fe-2S domain-containing protein [Planctomycetota bacterium]